jgi:hypothetical protein
MLRRPVKNALPEKDGMILTAARHELLNLTDNLFGVSLKAL